MVLDNITSLAAATPASLQGELADLYLDLLKKCLTRYLFTERWQIVEWPRGTLKSHLWWVLRMILRRKEYKLARARAFDSSACAEGRDRPAEAETMVGLRRLDNVQQCIRDVLDWGVSGDLVECGVWRGGVTIFMRACLEAYGDKTRRVWVADSFQGLPQPNPEAYPADASPDLWRLPSLAVPLDEVKSNFAKYGLLDDRVRFLAGWFSETLPVAPMERLAVLRIDADLYESTMDALKWLHPKVSNGGYVIVDDYFLLAPCRQAVDDFRMRNHIDEPLRRIDWNAGYWRKA